MKRFLVLFFLASILLFGANRAIIVFDASGSMWGQIGGKAKIDIAKNALQDVVKNWNSNTELGLMVYGHRKKGDCNDIESVVPVGNDTKSAILKKVATILPKGKTPISRSLKLAAKELKFTEDKATIILISDGKETCDLDPCNTAKELKKQGIDFVTHVIGFNVDKSTDKQLACIANATGGEYFSAKNAKELNSAIKSVVKKVEKPKIVKLKNNLEITAHEEGGKPVKAYHRLYLDEKFVKSCRSYVDNSCKRSLKAGVYTIKSEYNKFKVINKVELKENKLTKLNVIFKRTGVVEFSASESKDSKWIRARGWIYKVVDGAVSESNLGSAHTQKTEPTKVRLPAGKYVWKGSYNHFKKEVPFEIKPGETTKVHIIMGQTGIVEISASESKGGKWISCYGWIYPVIDGEVGESNVGTAYPQKDKPRRVRLPAGKYMWKGRYNSFEKEVPFEIKPGETTKVHIIMGQTGIAKFSASDGSTGKWIRDYGWVYPVVDGEIGESNVGSAYPRKDSERSLRLPVGKYVWKVKFGDFEKIVPFEVKHGKVTKVHTVFNTFIINSKCPSSGSVHYEIYASSGQLVYSKDLRCGKSLKVALDKGDYTLEAKFKNILQKAKFSVKDGSGKLDIEFKEVLNKDELIKADMPKQNEPSPKPKVKEKAQDSANSLQINKKENSLVIKGKDKRNGNSVSVKIGNGGIEIEGISKEEQEKMKKSLEMIKQMGQMLNNKN